jgi:fucose 4-O-acetylase-like acetyltransferase
MQHFVCFILQVLLLEELLSLQQQLPPSLLQMPPAEECHSAGTVLQFYQQQLSNALEDHAACAGALGSLQRIGNCLALLHLVSVQQAVQATPQFMQVSCRHHTHLSGRRTSMQVSKSV